MPRIAALAAVMLALLAPSATAAGTAGTARALAAQMKWAGSGSGALAVDLDSGTPIYARRAGTPRMPASVEKLYTSATALRRLGAGARLGTTALADAAPDPQGNIAGNLYLRGGGDPTFDSLDLGRLAQQVADAGVTSISGRVVGDETGFDGRRGVPSSAFRLTSDVGPLSALTYNHGRTGRRSPYWQADPARFAAAAFAKELRKRGVDVPKTVKTHATPVTAAELTQWRSLPLSDLLRLMNRPSDNFIAETLMKVLGARFGGDGSTPAGARVVREELAELQVAPKVVDGSGLSRSDRTSPRQVVQLLTAMGDDAAFASSLAVAGRSGTLAGRMRGTAAQDRCQAKTGTLHDVSALAGYCTAARGAHVAFAILMNSINPWSARRLQDRMAIALAKYAPLTTRRGLSPVALRGLSL